MVNRIKMHIQKCFQLIVKSKSKKKEREKRWMMVAFLIDKQWSIVVEQGHWFRKCFDIDNATKALFIKIELRRPRNLAVKKNWIKAMIVSQFDFYKKHFCCVINIKAFPELMTLLYYYGSLLIDQESNDHNSSFFLSFFLLFTISWKHF